MAQTKLSFDQIEGSWVSAKNYGIKGDGSTDDYAAIQALFDTIIGSSTTRKHIHFPAGIYKLTNTPKIREGVATKRGNWTISGDGRSTFSISLAKRKKSSVQMKTNPPLSISDKPKLYLRSSLI